LSSRLEENAIMVLSGEEDGQVSVAVFFVNPAAHFHRIHDVGFFFAPRSLWNATLPPHRPSRMGSGVAVSVGVGVGMLIPTALSCWRIMLCHNQPPIVSISSKSPVFAFDQQD
jgi:hypothetical protein